MDLKLSLEQDIFRNSIRNFLSEYYSRDLLRENLKGQKEFPSGLWKKISELGWLGVPIPEDYGGSGLGFLELVILFEEIGRACLVSPVLSTILSSLLILQTGSEKQKTDYLSEMIKGNQSFALALSEADFYYRQEGIKVRAIKKDNGYTLEGSKLFVADAQMADFIICVARTSETGITNFMVRSNQPGIRLSALKTISTDWLYEVEFHEVPLSSEDILGEADKGWGPVENIISKAALLKSAEMLGGAKKVLEMVVDYLKIRVQFGHPLGSFQAVQHKCAEMFMEVDMSHDLVYHAAWMWDQGLDCLPEIAMAKAWVGDAYRRVVQTAHQLFGAIGYCQEHDLFLYLRQAKSGEVSYGDGAFQRDRIAKYLYR